MGPSLASCPEVQVEKVMLWDGTGHGCTRVMVTGLNVNEGMVQGFNINEFISTSTLQRD